MVIKTELKKLGLHYISVGLGEIEILENLTDIQREQFSIALQKFGFELMEGRKEVLVEKIKSVIIETVHYNEAAIKVSFSAFIAGRLHHHYNYLSKLFSEAMGITIEHFMIAHKIERVKELMFYDELNLTEISYMLNYSSVAHLSNQFKKVTGLTPSDFKKQHQKRTQPLYEIGKSSMSM